MLSKPLAFVVLAVACVTAAAGGAYVAARRNTAAVSAAAPALPPARPGTPTSAAPPVARPAVEAETPASKPAPEPEKATAATPKDQPSATAPVRHTDPPKAAAASAARSAPQFPSSAPEPAAPPPNQPAVDPPVAAAPPPATQGEAGPPPDPQPAAAAAPQFDEIVVPASSIVGVQIETPISSESAEVEDRVLAHVTRDVLADGRVAIPAGARVLGTVTLVDRGGKMKTPARLGIRFHTLVLADGSEVPLRTQEILRDGESPSADSAKKIGGAAIVGAILGGILGGGKGAVIGGTTGAGAGTAAVMAGDRMPAVIAQGATFNVRLAAPATIQVERR